MPSKICQRESMRVIIHPSNLTRCFLIMTRDVRRAGEFWIRYFKINNLSGIYQYFALINKVTLKVFRIYLLLDISFFNVRGIYSKFDVIKFLMKSKYRSCSLIIIIVSSWRSWLSLYFCENNLLFLINFNLT